MAIDPFYRLIRYGEHSAFPEYVTALAFANDRVHCISAYYVIEQDLKKLFEYIDPRDANLKAHSFRTFELLLRIATEFESNCKAILQANKYAKRPKDMDMTDYVKIDAATKLSEYRIALNTWHPGGKVTQPLAEWAGGRPLPWYQDYNRVKHNRTEEFGKATLENVVMGAASLFALLFAQFGDTIFDPYQETGFLNGGDFISITGSLFSVRPYRGWDSLQLYHTPPEPLRLQMFDFDAV